ncbi:MAG: prephenate dehydratase [Muribaculaceae bacterium]|nr:prephenate dehydratase [Muribaculaceae bacterium]
MQRRVTIQGVAGCYHDAAARSYFADRFPEDTVETIPCDTFPRMFEVLEQDASLIGVLAIENTIAGALLQNHELLRKSPLTVVGEFKMRISHVLAALPGQEIDDLDSVFSHPIALMQCDNFFRSHGHLKKIEHFDTAGAARDIASDRLIGRGAVCGEYAAQLYGLNILQKGIETNKRNFTRFLILADPLIAPDLQPDDSQINKASIVFTLPHSQGALSKVLTIFSFYDMNLSKIQSTPILGREWEYRFYLDLTFSSYARFMQAINAVRPLMSDFRMLGTYRECENPV